MADVEDIAHKGKEKVAQLPKTTKRQGGSGKPRGTGRKSLDSRCFEAQRRAELEMPSEATTTISLSKSKYSSSAITPDSLLIFLY
jgi:hypothetical protein